jgi:hypothetical protein
MKCLATVVRCFGAHEFAVRRLYATDPDFQEICEDYAIAIGSLNRWKDDQEKSVDYQDIVTEIEAEILAYLEAAHLPR